MKKKWIIIGVSLIIVVMIGLTVWSERGSDSAEEVDIVALKKQTIENTIMVPGHLKLADKQTVYFQEEKGMVDEILVEEGDEVEKGDNLIRYKNQELINEKEQNQLQLEVAYAEIENIKKQHQKIDENLAENKDNEQLKTEHEDIAFQERQKNLEIEQLKLEIESIKKEIENMTVTSDINGTIVSIDEETAFRSEQSEQQPMIQIGSLDNMLVEGDISEYDMLKVEREQSVTLTSDAVPEKSWEGEISLISDLPKQSQSEEDNSGAIYAIEANVEDDISLKPGFKILMDIEIDKKKVDVLPLLAVENDDDADYVYIVEDGLASRKKVTTGTTTNKVIEIEEGLEESAEVIANSEQAHDGQEVNTE